MSTDIHVFIDARTQHCAALLFVIRGKVTSTANKRNSKRGLGNNHAPKVANVNKVELSIMDNNDIF